MTCLLPLALLLMLRTRKNTDGNKLVIGVSEREVLNEGSILAMYVHTYMCQCSR